MLQITPDEHELARGYGFLVFPAQGIDPAQPLTVEVFETFGGRWLGRSAGDSVHVAVGDANWQSVPHAFGPYPVQIVGGMARLRIGPEIVNKVPEYTHCRIKVGTLTADVIWPDDVIPRAGAAALGGITTIAQPQPQIAPPEPLVQPAAAEPAQATTIVEPLSATPQPSSQGRGFTLPLLALLAAAAVAGLLFFVFGSDNTAEVAPPEPAPATEPAQDTTTPPADAPEPEPQAAPEPPPDPIPDAAPAVVAQPASDACAPDYLTSAAADFAALYPLLEACTGQLSPDAVFEMLESARSAGDAAALLRFGHLYDPAVEDPLLETGLGLSAPSNLAQAVDYYSQAKAKGSQAGADALTDACARLAQDAITLSQGAYDDFCR